MVFTGMRVLFGDFGRFQNVGIQPDDEVTPTIDGLRRGDDEVLNEGVEVLLARVGLAGD
jgi:hypothetical protein